MTLLIVLDTSFLVAWANQHDAHHVAALERTVEIAKRGALLPEYVFIETATVLAARKDVAFSARFCETLLDSREIEFVPCGPILLDAFHLFRRQKKFTLSLVDVAIVLIARERGTTDVATFDDALAKAVRSGV